MLDTEWLYRTGHTGQVAGVLAVGTRRRRTADDAGALREAVWVADIVGHRWFLDLLVRQQRRVSSRVLTIPWHQHWWQHYNKNSISQNGEK